MQSGELYGLPNLARIVAEELGVPAAIRLMNTMGGESVTVPHNAEGSVLAERLGIEIAAILSERFAPAKIHIPNGKQWRSIHRRKAVIASPTKTANELARELDISERHVRGIRAVHRRQIIEDGKRRKQTNRTKAK